MTYYVDVSKFQQEDMAPYKTMGADGVIAQITVGTSIIAPKCKAQLSSAKKHGMHRLTYHYATFGNSTSQAKAEAKYACKRAKQLGFKTIHIFCDWEQQDNNTSGSVNSNTDAILSFMNEVSSEGFTPGLYTSASLARTKINTKAIIKKYGSCLWIASYYSNGAVSSANMAYFPSMDGVTMWQFTSQWHGANVDANKVVYDPFKLKKQTKPKSKVKTVTITGKDIKIKES